MKRIIELAFDRKRIASGFRDFLSALASSSLLSGFCSKRYTKNSIKKILAPAYQVNSHAIEGI